MPRDKGPNLKQKTKGRWRGILPLLGVPSRILNGKHHPCPIIGCGGKDRFRFDDKNGDGTYFCSQCGAGNGIDLVMNVHGWDFITTAKRIEDVIGDIKPIVARTERSSEEKRDAQRRVWQSGRRVEATDPAGRYLQSRLGEIIHFPRCLHFADRVRYQDDKVSYHPALLAMVQDAQGTGVNIHRTYLTPDGQKADVPEVRKMMTGDVPKGSAVRLFPFYEDVLGVAEGIETAWAAHILFDIPVWSTIDAGKMADWEPPADVKKIVIFGDLDDSYTGQWAAFALARRIKARKLDGHSVYEVEVKFPPEVGKDWNDIFREIALA